MDTLKELLGELRGRDAGDGGSWEEILKTVSAQAVAYTSTGYEPYNLDPVGKLLLPELTPLQNMGAYSVKAGETGDNFEYRAIIAKNTAKSGGAAGNTSSVNSTSDTGRAQVIDYTYLKRLVTRQKFAPESAITWELYRASGAFNALGKVTIGSLITAKEIEERRMLGDCSTALGTPAKPVGTAVVGGGSLTAVAHTIKVIALNYHGWWYWIADALPFPTVDVTPIITHGLTAGGVQGESIASAASDAVTPASNGSITASVAPKKGAFGYLWLVDAATGTYKFATATAAPYATITSVSTLTVAVPTVDGSVYDLDGWPMLWNGLLSQIALDPDIPGEYFSASGNGSPGAFSTTGSGCGVLELERQFAAIARKYGTSPELAIMSPATLATLSNTAIGSGAPAYRFTKDAGGDGHITAGSILKALHNQYMDKPVQTLSHPLFPDGKVILYTKTVPYANSGVGVNFELHCTDHFLQDFYARLTDVAPPGPWAIKTFGAPCLIWPRVCGVIDDVQVAIPAA